MSDEKFKLPLSSYDEVVKIIIGYGHINKSASLDEISKLTTLHKTIVSRNAGFLIGIGVLDTGAKKAITSPGLSLARALEHDMSDEISEGWRDRVMATEFLTNLLTSIRIRKGMTEDTLTSHIAYSAGQPNKKPQLTGSRTIIDILRVAGCIKEEDGKIIAPDGISADIGDKYSESTEIDDTVPPHQVPVDESNTQQISSSLKPSIIQTDDAVVRINIELKVECTADDLEELGPKLRRLLSSVHNKSETDI